MSGSDSGKITNSGAPVTRSSVAGFALTNGTGVFITTTAANDGQLHQFFVSASLRVTVLEVGGQMTLTWTASGQAYTVTAFAAALAVGNYTFFQNVTCDPNTAVAVNQATALTSGTASFVGAISGG